MTMLHDIQISDLRVSSFCKASGIKRLWIFGSLLRDDFGPESDIDVLVELGHRDIGAFQLGGLAADLSDLWDREVHITTLGGVPESDRLALLQSSRLEFADDE